MFQETERLDLSKNRPVHMLVRLMLPFLQHNRLGGHVPKQLQQESHQITIDFHVAEKSSEQNMATAASDFSRS